MQSLKLDLAKNGYNIYIGDNLLTKTDGLIGKYERIAIITDENIASLHLETLLSGLGQKPVKTIILPAGENTKSFEFLQYCLDELLQESFGRDDLLIAFGGGVIGDLAGFVASIIKRGCNYVQIPTTLLAQIDSSVGGKTAINTKWGKNLVGTFYQPKSVIIDINVLSTLDERQIRAGYAEVLKYALINNREFFVWLDENAKKLFSRDKHILQQAIMVSCQAKADIVARDEREKGERALLNLGHSFGHALEAAAGYDGRLLHGEAVSAGMLMAFEFSHRLGFCNLQEVEKLSRHLRNNNMVLLGNILNWLETTPKRIFELMKHDKKNKGENINLILTNGIGKAFIEKNADKQALFEYLQKVIK